MGCPQGPRLLRVPYPTCGGPGSQPPVCSTHGNPSHCRPQWLGLRRDPQVPRLGRGLGPGGCLRQTPPRLGARPDPDTIVWGGRRGRSKTLPGDVTNRAGAGTGSRPQPTPDGCHLGSNGEGRTGGAGLRWELKLNPRLVPSRPESGHAHSREEEEEGPALSQRAGPGSLTAAIRPPSKQGARDGANLSGHTPWRRPPPPETPSTPTPHCT